MYVSFNDAVNAEVYVALNERMINERLISCSVETNGLRNLHGRTDGRAGGRAETDDEMFQRSRSGVGDQDFLIGPRRIPNRKASDLMTELGYLCSSKEVKVHGFLDVFLTVHHELTTY